MRRTTEKSKRVACNSFTLLYLDWSHTKFEHKGLDYHECPVQTTKDFKYLSNGSKVFNDDELGRCQNWTEACDDPLGPEPLDVWNSVLLSSTFIILCSLQKINNSLPLYFPTSAFRIPNLNASDFWPLTPAIRYPFTLCAMLSALCLNHSTFHIQTPLSKKLKFR